MDPLKTKLDEVSATLNDLRQEAGDKYRAAEEAKKAVAEYKGTDPLTTEHPLFKAMDDAGKAYGDVGDRIADAEKVKAGLVDAITRTGGTPPVDTAPGSKDPERDAYDRKNADRRSPGQRITDGDSYKALIESGVLSSSAALGVKRLGEGMTRDETKALITGTSDTSVGAFMTPDRIGYFPMPLRPLTVVDLITVGDTDSDLVEYVQQTSFTNAAGNIAEATDVTGASGTKPQSDFSFDVIQTPVKQIAHWVAATRRALADAGQLRTIIDGLLRYGLDRRIEDQVVAGDGAGENLRGILNTTGLNSIAAGPASIADKIHFGITQNLLDGFASTGVLLNPLDWETVRLSREDTGGPGTGAYLFGSPSQVGVETLWGRPVAVTPAIPQGTGLVGDLRAAILWVREGTQILASDSHADFFIRNLIAVLAENRAAFGIPYPQAIAEVNFAAV
jgi:HK97 family phage major capsid protein